MQQFSKVAVLPMTATQPTNQMDNTDQDITDLNYEIIEALAHAFERHKIATVYESSEDGSPIIVHRNGRTFKVVLKEI